MLGTRDHLRTPPGSGDEPEPTPVDASPVSSRAFWLAMVATLLPIVVATIRAAFDGWVPVGDNGYFAVRARDVLTAHHPLLGTWTSASLNTDTNFNNPGPLLFDLLAIPTKLIPGGIGVAVGSALINCLAVVGIGLVARRRGGPVLGVAALAVSAALTWSMGSQLLFDPWQPHSLLLTFLLGLLLIWSLACGDPRALPWAVFVGSVVIQTHLSYAILLVALAAWGVVALALSLRRRRRDDPDGWPALRRTLVRSLGVTAVVGALCWSQPLIEQVTNGGDGNLIRLAGNATTAPETVGPRLGAKIVASVVAIPPFWLRPSFAETLQVDRVGTDAPQGWAGPSDAATAGSLLALAGLLGVALWDARRRADRVSSAALSTAAVTCAAGIATAVKLPLGILGLPAHQFRWLWPIAAFTTFALVVALIRRVAEEPRRQHRATLALAALTVVLAALNLPTYNAHAGPSDDEWAIPSITALNDQLGSLEGEGTVVLRKGLRFAEPYSGSLMVELRRRDIPFVVDQEDMVRQLGDRRRLVGDAQLLLIREGESARETPPGTRRVAFVEGLSDEQRDELTDLQDELVEHLQALGEVPLDQRGRVAMANPDHARVASALEARDLDALFGPEALGDLLVEHDLLDLDPSWSDRLDRYAELRRLDRFGTVALFLAPLDQEVPL